MLIAPVVSPLDTLVARLIAMYLPCRFLLEALLGTECFSLVQENGWDMRRVSTPRPRRQHRNRVGQKWIRCPHHDMAP